MFTDEEFAAHEAALRAAKADAEDYLAKAALPAAIHVAEESLSSIGKRGEDIARKVLKQLNEVCGTQLPEVIGFAARSKVIALARGAAYMCYAQAVGLIGKNAYTDRLTTVEGFGDSEGASWNLYDHLHDNERQPELEALRVALGAVDLEKIRIIVMEASAVHCFSTASTLIKAGDISTGLDVLGEAFDAMALADFSRGWSAARETEGEERDASSFARRGADARHRENRSMREQVFSWLDVNMTELPSLDAAADAIAGKVVPVRWRTARDWVGQWKKSRASKSVVTGG